VCLASNKAFCFEERQAIEKGLSVGDSYLKIAKNLSRSKKGVYNEVRKYSFGGVYSAEEAQKIATAKKEKRRQLLIKRFSLDEISHVFKQRSRGISIDVISVELATDSRNVKKLCSMLEISKEDGDVTNLSIPARLRILEEKL